MFVDLLANRMAARLHKPLFRKYRLGAGRHGFLTLILVKPLTYMNRSGDILPELLKRTDMLPEEILVVCDTLDLPPGVCRLKKKGSSAGHRGLRSIIERLGTERFMRLYIGIGHPGDRSMVIPYVLNEPTHTEQTLLREALDRAADGIFRLPEITPEVLMNELNRRTGS